MYPALFHILRVAKCSTESQTGCQPHGPLCLHLQNGIGDAGPECSAELLEDRDAYCKW